MPTSKATHTPGPPATDVPPLQKEATNTEEHQRKTVCKIHLNAGFSDRFVKAVEKEFPHLEFEWTTEGEYGVITLKGMTDFERLGLLNKIKNMYPLELEYTYPPR